MDDSCLHCVSSITREITMSDLNASKRRGFMNKIWCTLKRPATFKIAAFVVNVINLVVRALDHFE